MAKKLMQQYKGVNIYVDNDDKLNYENLNFLGKQLNKFILIPLFSIIPKKLGTNFFVRSSKDAYDVYKNAKTSTALEVLYNFDGKFHLTNAFFDGIFTYFWHHNIINAKAVRNRIKLVKRELKYAIESIYQEINKPVKIFSLASGSARAIIEVLAELKFRNIKMEARLLDLNSDALELSKKIAKEYGVIDMILTYNDKVSNFYKYCDSWQPDVIEMVGFLDYLNQDKAILLSQKIYNHLSTNGIFITANIRDNKENVFISKIINWEMEYRNEDELAEVLLGGRFKAEKCKILYEPTLIHGVAISKR